MPNGTLLISKLILLNLQLFNHVMTYFNTILINTYVKPHIVKVEHLVKSDSKIIKDSLLDQKKIFQL